MQEIKDEDRIIGRIYRGEWSFDSEDIRDLENGNLSMQEEESFIKLAEEINETIKRNQNLRKEMKEKLDVVENSDYIVRSALSKIENKIQDLKYQYNKKRYISSWKLMGSAMLMLLSSFIAGGLVSMLTSAIWALALATCGGFLLSFGVFAGFAVKNQKKCEEIQKQIKDLEKARLDIISDGVDETKTQENEIKMNIVKNIYKTREQEKQHVDILDL